jgi:hypothetical protein
MEHSYEDILAEMQDPQGFVASLFAGWNHGAAMF